MTREDAKYILSGLMKSLNEYCGLNDTGFKAFNMAFKALEQPDLTADQILTMKEQEYCRGYEDGRKSDCPWFDGKKCNSPNDPTHNECDYDRKIFPDDFRNVYDDGDKLDETIRDFERNAQNDDDNFHLTGAKCFNGCAEYEWRIVSWLRELKEWRQQGGI